MVWSLLNIKDGDGQVFNINIQLRSKYTLMPLNLLIHGKRRGIMARVQNHCVLKAQAIDIHLSLLVYANRRGEMGPRIIVVPSKRGRPRWVRAWP